MSKHIVDKRRRNFLKKSFAGLTGFSLLSSTLKRNEENSLQESGKTRNVYIRLKEVYNQN